MGGVGCAQRITENNCLDGSVAACCLRDSPPPVAAAVGGARDDARLRCRCTAVVPDAPPATMLVMAASTADSDGGYDGDDERTRALGENERCSCCFDGSAGPEVFFVELGAHGLLLRVKKVVSRCEMPGVLSLEGTATEEYDDGGRRRRACLDDAMASACAAVALAASLVCNQS
jgi:hypothetical protein